MFSLLAHGSTKDVMILLYAGFCYLLVKESMKTVWGILKWSFSALATGRWPAVDWKGNEYPDGSREKTLAGSWLANGYRGVVWSIQGDLDYFSRNLWLRHWSASRPCAFCPCNNTDGDPMCWSEFRDNPAVEN